MREPWVGGSFVWLEWVDRRRCYAVIDEWWEVRLPDGEGAGQKSVAHRTRSEQREALAVSSESPAEKKVSNFKMLCLTSLVWKLQSWQASEPSAFTVSRR